MSLQRPIGDFSDVVNLDVFPVFFDGVLEIPFAPGTGGYQGRGPGSPGLLQPFVGCPQSQAFCMDKKGGTNPGKGCQMINPIYETRH